MLYRQIVGFSCLLKRQQSQQANWTRGGWKQTISVSDRDEEMLILPGHLCSWANSLWKGCGHTLLSWWRSDRRYLDPATSVGLCIHGGTLQRPYASGMPEFWFHQLFREQFVLSGLVKRSWAERLPSLGGGGGAEWTVAWLCKPTPQSLSRPALPPVLEDTSAVPGKHGGKKCALRCVLPGGGTTADGPSRGTLHAFRSSLPMHCHYITFHCLWEPRGKHGYCWTVSQVTHVDVATAPLCTALLVAITSLLSQQSNPQQTHNPEQGGSASKNYPVFPCWTLIFRWRV